MGLSKVAAGTNWGEGKNQVPAVKRFLSEVKQGIVPETIWTYKEVGHTQAAKKSLLEIFSEDLPDFRGVKPVELIKRIISLTTTGEDIVLDSFAGSGTTAQAVLELNKEESSARKFVLCQTPDESPDSERNICDTVTAERVRRIIRGIPDSKDDKLRGGLGGTFSYFRLGKELQKQGILDGKDLPSYEALAGYVYFTATGEEFQPGKMKKKIWFIGTSRDRDIFLIYEPDVEKLKDMALSLDLARAIARHSTRPKLVFAPTKYLDQDYLDRLRIEFCQLPFEIYQRASK